MTMIFPYAVLPTAPELRLTSVQVDDSDLPEDRIDAENQLVTLGGLAGTDEWGMVRLSFEVTVPPEDVLTPTESWRVVVAASCAKTNVRQAVELGRSEGEHRWEGNLSLRRDELAGRGVVTARIAERDDLLLWRYLGQSRDWTLIVDPTASLPVDGTLRVRWADFGSTDEPPHVPDPARRESFYVDLESPIPVVYLNASFDGLRELLAEERPSDMASRTLREMELSRIATTTWVALGTSALAGVAEGEDGFDWPEEEWQRDVLHKLLPLMYPELEVEAALEAAASDWSAGDGARGAATRLYAAVAAHVGSGRTLSRSMRALPTGG